MRTLTTEEFIKRSNLLHNNTYNYSKVNYINSSSKVEIVCKEHGSFFQQAGNHLNGQHCPSCAPNLKHTDETFILKANKIHGNTYDYSKVRYKGNKNKVTIVCKIHGDFQQTPNSHFHGRGCPICAGQVKGTTSSFIYKAIKIHGNLYDYSKVVYTTNKDKVIITCKIHGDFTQQPVMHINAGQGCPKCGELRRHTTFQSNNNLSTLYYIKILNTPYFKVGVTTRGINKRFESCKHQIEVLRTWVMGALDAFQIEQEILSKASNVRYSGAPILKGGNTEIVTVDILPLLEHTITQYLKYKSQYLENLYV